MKWIKAKDKWPDTEVIFRKIGDKKAFTKPMHGIRGEWVTKAGQLDMVNVIKIEELEWLDEENN